VEEQTIFSLHAKAAKAEKLQQQQAGPLPYRAQVLHSRISSSLNNKILKIINYKQQKEMLQNPISSLKLKGNNTNLFGKNVVVKGK
jgi:hypothetical protein